MTDRAAKTRFLSFFVAMRSERDKNLIMKSNKLLFFFLKIFLRKNGFTVSELRQNWAKLARLFQLFFKYYFLAAHLYLPSLSCPRTKSNLFRRATEMVPSSQKMACLCGFSPIGKMKNLREGSDRLSKTSPPREVPILLC